MAFLAALTNLQDLNLEDTSITDAGLAQLKALTKLTRLNISGTEVTDAGLAHLKAVKSLKEIKLPINEKITDAGEGDLRKALPDLKVSR